MSFRFIQNKTADRYYFQPAVEKNACRCMPNPMRGWYSIYTFQADQVPDFEELKWCLKPDESMALVIFDIGCFRCGELSETALLRLEEILEFFSEHDRDVILRPVYDREGLGEKHEPESFELVMRHLKQMGAKLQENPYSVVIFQGLLIGSWGEMHGSAYLSEEHLRQLSQCILPCLGKDIYLAVRTPAQWRQLTDEKTFSSGQYAIGLFDDGIFGSKTHLGTFGLYTRDAAGWQKAWIREEELLFENKLCLKAPCGGEVLADTDGRIWQIEDMIQEMRMMHVSYLNSQHDMNRLREWKQQTWQGQSFYDYITGRLGYCFRIDRAGIQVRHGIRRKLYLVLDIENEGFGVCFQESEVQIQLEASEESRTVSAAIDLRQWMPEEKKQVMIELPFIEGKIYLTARRKRDNRSIFFLGQEDERLYLGQLRLNQ